MTSFRPAAGWWLLGLAWILAAPVQAQLARPGGSALPFAPGTKALGLTGLDLLRGQLPDFGAETAPAATLVAFYTGPARQRLPGELQQLRAFERQWPAGSLATVLVVDAEGPELPAELGSWAVLAEENLRAVGAFGVAVESPDRFAVLDRAGRRWYQGGLAAGVHDAIAAVVAGTIKAGPLVKLMQQRQQVVATFGEVLPANGEAAAAWLTRSQPHDGEMWGARYAFAAALPDPQPRRAVRGEALQALAGTVRPLAAFVDFAVRALPREVAAARELVAALQPVAQQADRDPVVALALLRALLAADVPKELGRHLVRVPKLLGGDPELQLELAAMLASVADAPRHRAVAEQALQRAVAAGAEPMLLPPVRYMVLRWCIEDATAARTELEQFLRLGREEEQAELAAFGLNNACWYTLTEWSTYGRRDRYALGIAERMLEQRDQLAANEFDTVALAWFRVGDAAQAVELQEKAIAMGGAGATYRARLERFRADLPSGDGAGPGASGGR